MAPVMGMPMMGMGMGMGMMPNMSMMGMGMATTPMMGLGMMPTAPMLSMGTVGVGALPTAPMLSVGTVGVGALPAVPSLPPIQISGLTGASMSLSMQASGDAATGLMAALLRTSILQPPANRSVTQADLDAMRQQILDAIKKAGKPGSEQTSTPGLPSPREVEKARQEVRQMVAEGAAQRARTTTPDVERVREPVRPVAAEATVRQPAPSAQDVERARAELRQMLAETAARKAQNRPAATVVADRAK